MSTHDICFLGEIRKILCGYPLLSVAMSGPVGMSGARETAHFLHYLLIYP